VLNDILRDIMLGIAIVHPTLWAVFSDLTHEPNMDVAEEG